MHLIAFFPGQPG